MFNLKDMFTGLVEDLLPDGERRTSRRTDEPHAFRAENDRRESRSGHRRSREERDRERFSFFED